MTIKQQGGVFGRNPTFNNATVDGTLTVDQIVEKTGAVGITLDGVTLKDGNVVLGDGNGIDFSATSGTGTSELLDDYEEGTFTCDIAIDGNTGDAATQNTQVAKYVKVGKVVTISVELRRQPQDGVGNTPTGALTIAGSLPFAPDGHAEFQMSGTRALNYAAEHAVICQSGSTLLYAVRNDSTDLTIYTSHTVSDARTIKYLAFSGSYLIA